MFMPFLSFPCYASARSGGRAIHVSMVPTKGARFEGPPYEEASLDDWVEALSHVYQDHVTLYQGIAEYWLHATNAAQKLAEEVRRGRPVEIIKHLGKAFTWACTTANRTLEAIHDLDSSATNLMGTYGTTYGSWIAYKYPGVCHYCHWAPCRCPTERQILEERNDLDHPHKDQIQRAYQAIRENRPEINEEKRSKFQDSFREKNLSDQIATFDRIYQNANYERPLEAICFHYLEEVGEVAREISWFDALETIKNSASSDSLREEYREAIQEVILSGELKSDLKQWAKKGIIDPQWGPEVAEERRQELSEIGFDEKIESLQLTFAGAVMMELTDVFSWTTGLDYKIRQLCARVGARQIDLPLYMCDKIEGIRRTYIRKVGLENWAQCSYCGERKCTPSCVAKRLVREALRKHVKRELS